jgi:predicted transcriptional regulator
MINKSSAVPEDALEDIAYFARSKNRVRLLVLLASGSYTRRELGDITGVAKTTIGRILNEFSERGWSERTDDGGYTATPIGRQVVVEFMPLVEAMSAINQLDETVAWFQATENPIGMGQLTDATIVRPDPADPMAPVNAYMSDLRTASEFHCLVGVAPPESFEKAMRDGVVERGMHAEHVINESEYTYLLQYPNRLTRWREYIEAGANVYCYDGAVPCNVMIFDETVYIANTQSEYGEPYTVIESHNDAVLSWGHELIDTYRNDAKRLDGRSFRDGLAH